MQIKKTRKKKSLTEEKEKTKNEDATREAATNKEGSESKNKECKVYIHVGCKVK